MNIVQRFLDDFVFFTRKFLLHAIITAVLLAPAVAGYAVQSMVLSRDTVIVVGGDYDFPPYSFLDSNGMPTGFCTDLSREIGKVTGFRFQFQLEKWADVRKKLEEGSVQIVQEMACPPDNMIIVLTNAFSSGHWSIAMDLKILTLTLWKGFVNKNAY